MSDDHENDHEAGAPTTRVRDREVPRSRPARTASSDREFPASSWPPAGGGDREDGGRPRTRLTKTTRLDFDGLPDDADWDLDDEPVADRLGWWQEWRFLRESGTTADHIDYARNAAYTTGDGWWRKANVLYVEIIGRVVIALCDLVKFAFGISLARAGLSVLVLIAAPCLLNRIPVTAWLVPDGWDIATWFSPDPLTVDVPIDLPVGEG